MIAGTRFGLYDPAKRALGVEKGQSTYLVKNYLAGMLSGAVSSFTGNPFYLVRARLQASNSGAVTRGRHVYTSAFQGFKSVYQTDGVGGFFRGIGGAIPRVSFGSATQLSSYEFFKDMLLRRPYLGYSFQDQTVLLHLSASILAGFFCVTAMNPFDVISVRLYNQPLDPLTGKGLLYTGPLDCARKTLVTEGVKGAFKGWTVQYIRLGPHTVFTFLFWEQLKLAYEKITHNHEELVTPDHVTKLADTKTPATLYQMGQAIFENSTDDSNTSSITQSVLLWQTAAAKGHLNAKYSYAQCLKQGKGELKADPVAATAHFRQLYEAKHAWGTYGYAEALNVGDGIRPNKPKAFELYMACAKSDLPPAYMAVANMYASGEGVAKVCEALEWYHKAAAKGDAHAKSILGDWYFNGVHNVVQNVSLGLSLRQEAARAGVPNALFNMGCLYRVGDHVEKNEAVAYQLFQQAAIKG
ncbi:hypothetical protein DYB38_004688 [Aphanomyces astaci]|uniref:Uncharacterized protein n=1 Tax=Aphanomyces astaci TaxID=112090 RepID=A0A397CCC5_APHAT|nr:hypothetical protein DYB38_004688 [Aphanomyces astaci]